MSGVIDRVIESWLTNSNERSYHIPFCQLLAAEGETIIYVSPHGPFEQGKDIVTTDKTGRVRGYQLKCGDIGIAEWRKFKGEITDLVEMPVNHPSLKGRRPHVPFLVTNGEIKDTAIRAIISSNQAWKKRKYQELRTVSRGELLKRFLAAHGSYLPNDLSDFKLFMELIVRDGREPLDKEKLSRLLESVLPLKATGKPKMREIRRALSSSLLLVGYIFAASLCGRQPLGRIRGLDSRSRLPLGPYFQIVGSANRMVRALESVRTGRSGRPLGFDAGMSDPRPLY